MRTALSEALAPFAKRIPREVREIEILRVSAQLAGDDFVASAESARKSALVWAKKKVGRALPQVAWDNRTSSCWRVAETARLSGSKTPR
jgi:hypothetical protein